MKKVVILIPLIFIIFMLILGLIQIWWSPAASWVSIIKIGLSWPVLVFIFLCSLIFLFEEPIRSFLNEIGDVQAPGWRLTRNQEERDTPNVNSFPVNIITDLITYRDSVWQENLETERQVAVSLSEQNEELKEHINQLQLFEFKWRCLYADLYLLLHTKNVLVWFSKINSYQRDLFDVVWTPIIPDANERNAVLNALMSVEFICQNENNIEISVLGKAYVNYMRYSGQIKDS